MELELKTITPRFDYEHLLTLVHDCNTIFEFENEKITGIYHKGFSNWIARDVCIQSDYKQTVLYDGRWVNLPALIGCPSLNKILNDETKIFLCFNSEKIDDFVIIGKLTQSIEDIIIEMKRRNFIEYELEIYQIN